MPVETGSINERVYVQLRESLMAGRFRPGEKLTLRSLASALGTSIMPVRDAVLRLSAERAIESSRRGVTIPVLTLDLFKDILRFRVMLEGDAADLAAMRATPQEMKQIELAAAGVVKAQARGQLDAFLAANQAFHFAVYRAAHNQLLQAMIETLWLQIGPTLAAIAGDGAFENDSIDLSAHTRLVAAIKMRDGDSARLAMQTDLKDSTDVFRPFLDGEDAPAFTHRKSA